jgi:hypothetical protein
MPKGSDLEVLRGARETLRRCRPAIAVTTYHRPEHCEKMIDFLQSLDVGYRFHVKGAVAFGASAPGHAALCRAGSPARIGERTLEA